MQNDKYVVFKRQDWHDGGMDGLDIEQVALEDAVVIRLQDVFAGPGLYAYANAIQTYIDALQYLGVADHDPDAIAHLSELRDFFAEMAQKAVDNPSKKVPD